MRLLKTLNGATALAVALVLSMIAGVFTATLRADDAHAQVPPNYFVQTMAVATAVAASGPASAVRNINLTKTYQVASSTASGTGTTVVTVEGSMSSSGPWDTIATVTLSTSSTPTSNSYTSLDRYMWVRPNATTLSGNTPTYSLTVGF